MVISHVSLLSHCCFVLFFLLFIYCYVMYLSTSANFFLYLSISLSVYISFCLTICLYIFLSICLSIYLSVCLFVYISSSLSICLSLPLLSPSLFPLLPSPLFRLTTSQPPFLSSLSPPLPTSPSPRPVPPLSQIAHPYPRVLCGSWSHSNRSLGVGGLAGFGFGSLYSPPVASDLIFGDVWCICL